MFFCRPLACILLTIPSGSHLRYFYIFLDSLKNCYIRLDLKLNKQVNIKYLLINKYIRKQNVAKLVLSLNFPR